MLGLFLDALISGHKVCNNYAKYTKKLTLQKGIANIGTNDVFSTKK